MGLLGRQGSGEEAISKIKGTKGRFTEEIRFSVRLGTNGRPASKLNARGQLHMHKHTKTNRHAHTQNCSEWSLRIVKWIVSDMQKTNPA